MAQNTGREMSVYTVFVDLETSDLIARDLRGVELARVSGEANHDQHAELARKASETLAAWYN